MVTGCVFISKAPYGVTACLSLRARCVQASKPGGNGSIGNGGLSSVLLAVQRKLPPNASLDSVVPCADDDIMGIVYSINTPADGSDAGGAGGGEERSSSGATIMRSGAGVLYGQNFKDLGVFSTPTDTLNACQGAISLLKDFKDSMQLQQAAAAAAGTAGLPQSLALSAMAARVQQAAHQQQQAAAAAAAVRGGLVGSSSQVVYNPAQGAVQLLPNQQLVLGDLQGSGGAPLQYVLLPSATTTLQLPHNMLGKPGLHPYFSPRSCHLLLCSHLH